MLMDLLPQLKPDQHVVFFGDSITEQHLWTRAIEDLLLWHEPSLFIRNRGWAANRACDGVARFDRDVAPLAPDWLFIAFGMNDGGYQAPNRDLAWQFRENLTHLVNKAREIGAEPILCSPSCVDEGCDPVLRGYNQTLADLVEVCRAVAKTEACRFVDLYRPLLAAGPGLIPDGIHPGPRGHLILAQAVASQLGLTERAVLDESGIAQPFLTWQVTVPDIDERYSVYIDDERCGNFSGADLTAGVAVTRGGLAARSHAVAELSRAIWQLDRAAWRSYGPLGQVGLRSPLAQAANQTAVAGLDETRRQLLAATPAITVYPEQPIALGPWELSGPYQVRSQVELLARRFAPEPGQPAGLQEQPLPWQPVVPQAPHGYVDLIPIYGPLTHAVAYARTTVIAPTAGELLLSLGSDDGYRLYLNGQLMAERPIFRGSLPGQELYRLPVQAGANEILLRLHQGIGGWNFYASAYLRTSVPRTEA